jgi:4-amino-4-deoxy-L-arabinose transferase-like glycosyltransferase
MIVKETSRDLLFLLFFGFLFCVHKIGLGSLASWDEAYYAIVSKEMFMSGEWVHLTYFGSPFYDKPPLYMWATNLFYHAYGINEFSTRLMSGLAGVGVIFTTYYLGKMWFDRQSALYGAGILLSSTDFLHYTRWATLDITTLFFFTLTILSFFKAKKNSAWFLLFWTAIAGCMMTKGPIFILALATIFLYSIWTRDFDWLKKPLFWLGFLWALVLVLPWHAAVYLHNPKLFMQDIVYKHYISRASGAIEGHTGNYYYYIRTLINKFHPWIVFVPAALPLAIYRMFKSEQKNAYRFMVLWIAVVLVFFTVLIQTKLQWYILPLYPALCLSIGIFFSKLLKFKWEFLMKLAIAVVLTLHYPLSDVMVQDYSGGIKAAQASVRRHVIDSEKLLLYQFHEAPAAHFYCWRSIQYVDTLAELDTWMTKDPVLWIMMSKKKYKEVASSFEKRGFHVLFESAALKDNVVFISNERV